MITDQVRNYIFVQPPVAIHNCTSDIAGRLPDIRVKGDMGGRHFDVMMGSPYPNNAFKIAQVL